MTIKLVIDVNLSPDWVEALRSGGFDCVHWASVGDARADDREIMRWALQNGYVVFTHDLDFGTMLALTHATGPSVIQVRAKDVLPDHLLPVVLATLARHATDLQSGAIVVVDQARARVRVLPL